MGTLDLSKPERLGVFRLDGASNLVRVSPLSLSDYRLFDSAMATLSRFRHWSETISMVKTNANELHETLLSLRQRQLGTEVTQEVIGPVLFESNRRLLNYLSSAKTFLDHTATHLSRYVGSREAADFEKRTNDAYDRRFPYRFLARLRNYAQHCGFPLGLIEHSATEDRRTGIRREEFVLSFNVDELLEEYNGWSRVRAELEARRPSFPFQNEASDYASEIEVLGDYAARLQNPQLKKASDVILEILAPALTPDLVAVVAQESDTTPGAESWRYERPPWELMRKLDLLPASLSRLESPT